MHVNYLDGPMHPLQNKINTTNDVFNTSTNVLVRSFSTSFGGVVTANKQWKC